jgi:hypothetical protein
VNELQYSYYHSCSLMSIGRAKRYGNSTEVPRFLGCRPREVEISLLRCRDLPINVTGIGTPSRESRESCSRLESDCKCFAFVEQAIHDSFQHGFNTRYDPKPGNC